MLHKLIEYEKSEAIVERVNGALYFLKCPECKKVHGSAMSASLLPDFLWCWGNPAHDDWKAYKREKGLTNADIANIIGITADSVKNQTQPNKDLPKWAISMLYEWKS